MTSTKFQHKLRGTGVCLIIGIGNLVIPAAAEAGKFNTVVSIGDVGKPFAGLMGVDDKPHSSAEYAGGKLIVLVFTCNHCPIAASYEERLAALADEFGPQGVRFVAISCSLAAGDDFESMKRRASERKFPFPYLHDPSQQTGRDYGASATPSVFVLKPDMKIAYLGAIDDSWSDPNQVTHRYLRDALTALLTGGEPESTETRPRGCPINYQ